MSWLLFLDESGHDHKTLPYEVRGGVALHAAKLWPFVQAVRRLEVEAFGVPLAVYDRELKGSSLLDRRHFKFAAQAGPMPDAERRRYCRRFLGKGVTKANVTFEEMTAYGQANLAMARGVFRLLEELGAKLFAVAVPRGVPVRQTDPLRLRRDHVVLFKRYEAFLKAESSHGVLVMDRTDRADDRRFIRRLEAHYLRETQVRRRLRRVAPVPLFVESDLTPGVQAADLAIYCVNWGYRCAAIGMVAEVREEVRVNFGEAIGRLRYIPAKCKEIDAERRGSIAVVADPLRGERGELKKKRQGTVRPPEGLPTAESPPPSSAAGAQESTQIDPS